MKMNKKTKKILATIWKIVGIFNLTWFIFWFVKVKILNEYGLVLNAIMFTVSVVCLIAYIIITGIFLLIKLRKKEK